MKIGEMAKRSDLPASTIRYYEQIGLIPHPTRESGQRIYEESTADLLKVVKIARGLGYSLEEVSPLLEAFRTRNEPSGVCHELVHSKLQELDALIQRTEEMKRILVSGLDCDCKEPTDCFLHCC